MTNWPKGFKRGSTMFKEVLNKKGKLDYYECVICGERYEGRGWVGYQVLESHEIMHLLQQVRANLSNQEIELVMQGEDESK